MLYPPPSRSDIGNLSSGTSRVFDGPAPACEIHFPASPARRACGGFRGGQSAVEYHLATLVVARPDLVHEPRNHFSGREHMAVYVQSESVAYYESKVTGKVSADLMLKFVNFASAVACCLHTPLYATTR